MSGTSLKLSACIAGGIAASVLAYQASHAWAAPSPPPPAYAAAGVAALSYGMAATHDAPDTATGVVVLGVLPLSVSGLALVRAGWLSLAVGCAVIAAALLVSEVRSWRRRVSAGARRDTPSSPPPDRS